MEYNGTIDSGAPLATWKLAPDDHPGLLAAMKSPVELPLNPMPSLQDLQRDLEALEQAEPSNRAAAERIRRKCRLRRAFGDGTTARLNTWIWRIGDAVLVGIPAEAYSMFQMALRNEFPNQAVVVMNVVNGWSAYLPPAQLYGRDIYQVSTSPYAVGCLENTISHCIETIRRILR